MATELTQAIVQDYLGYNPRTGVVVRRRRTSQNTRVGDVAGSPNAHGYLLICLLGRKYLAHRLAWLYMTGEWPHHEIDHINGVPDDNRWKNLRDVPHQLNGQNLRRLQRDNTSGHTGVSWHKASQKWQATIRYGGKMHKIGYFESRKAAAAAAKAARALHHPGRTI